MTDQVRDPLPCAICKKELEAITPGNNHADDANAFRAHGQYGSTKFDPVDGSWLEVNICDECFVELGRAGLVFIGSPPARYPRRLKPWQP